MIRQFMVYVRENKRLREEIEAELSIALKGFTLRAPFRPMPSSKKP